MATVSPQQIASLRKRTGVGVLAVKNALEESGGNEEKAIDILRKRGEAQAIKKHDRCRKEGGIAISSSGGRAAIVHLSCETDFVARGDDFKKAMSDYARIALEKGKEEAKKHAESRIPELVNKLGENIGLTGVRVVEGPVLGTYVHNNNKIGVIISLDGGNEHQARDIAMHAAAMCPAVVSPEEISNEVVEKEKEIWRAQLASEGKPQEIMEKIMVGKEKKFREESSLLKQAFVKDPSKTVEQYLDGAKVAEYVRFGV